MKADAPGKILPQKPIAVFVHSKIFSRQDIDFVSSLGGKMKKEKVLIAMSGGVDSSVAAWHKRKQQWAFAAVFSKGHQLSQDHGSNGR